MTHERDCIRGCTIDDNTKHLAVCADFGKTDGTCQGCAPVKARDGMLLCDRCYRRLSRTLSDAPDLVGHLRSIADPMKSSWNWDRMIVSSSPVDMPAPVSAAVIDAARDVMRMLHEWAAVANGEAYGRSDLIAGADAASAFDVAHDYARTILDHLDELANRKEVTQLWDAVMFRHEGEPDWWSVADALGKWSLDDRERWARNPCPSCDCKTIRVRPPRRRADVARFRCTTCDWEADDQEHGGFWAEAFAEVVPEVPAA
ncbi:hypothetical protein SK224_16565 [Microbacterium sp. BG28]|uniref:hypothetical protein n=1 Tax=Microbacterium sp. BG28 TaxID=3097356 RepID=UPI002A5A5023|nr:hypothetical protein [Microbacterium sp. BG28]MDY0830750.1 hypothetical protein [Microbacterium sp. BG28]